MMADRPLRGQSTAQGSHEEYLRMRIVLIAPFATHPKGTTRARVLPMATALAARGHRVTVLIPPWDRPEEAGHAETDGTLRLSWHLACEALRERPEVIHIFKPKAYSGLALFWLWLTGSAVPRVLDSDDWEGRGGWNDANPYPLPQRAFFQWQESFLPRHCVRAVTVASRTLETQMWGRGLPPAQVFYLPNGASRARYETWANADPIPVRTRLGLGGRPVVLLYTRFAEFGVARVAEVMAYIVGQVREVRLLVVGRGFFGEEERLRQEMANRGLEEHLVYAGWVGEPDLPAHLAAGDVALFPLDDRLINRAKCSAKLLELMVAGRPIVADAVGENREMIEHRVSGLLTPPDDVATQAAAIVALLRNPPVRQSLGEAAQRRAWQEYDWDRLVTRAETAYLLAVRQ
jgi:glycosyltransferase involved in cell wall biosynthesis